MIRVASVSLFRSDLETRMPFRYGIAEMRHLPHIFAVVEIEQDGRMQRGVASDHLPPKWFTKEPERDLGGEIEDMVEVIRHAAADATGLRAQNAFAVWEELDASHRAWAEPKGFPPLLAQFGVSMVERAILDAVCRSHGRPFHRLLREGVLGVALGRMHPELAGTTPADWLPASPAASVRCRHTVGLADVLMGADVAPGEAPDDDLPRSLEACIREYGLTDFKIKFTSDRAESLPRLARIVRVIGRETGGRFAASLDGNESFRAVEDFQDFWREAVAHAELTPLLSTLLFVEQPFHREVALGEEVAAALNGWSARPPIIIDESGADTGSLRRALACGYSGISHKNCKGVFHGVANACYLAWRRKMDPEGRYILSGEDLTTIGPVSLLQDLAVQAALGNESVERNGHHYIRGLAQWPASMREETLRCHGDLYRTLPDGTPSVRIEQGRVDLRSVNAAPFGVEFFPDLEQFRRV